MICFFLKMTRILKRKLAIITTHPIQYNAPLFKLLNKRSIIEIKVFYTWGKSVLEKKYDPGFDKIIDWDIPLLEGYKYEFLENVSKTPGSHHYQGIINPSINVKIDEFNPDAILLYGWKFKSHLKLLRDYKGVKKIWFRGDSNLLDDPQKFSMKNFLRYVFLKWVYSHVDRAFYVGTANKEYFIKSGLNENQLTFAPHAIDNFRFNQPIKNDYREILKIPKEAVVFLFAGKIESKKNPELLIQSFVKVQNENCHLMIVGNGVMEISLKNFVNNQSEEIKNRIHFLPFQNQSIMPDIYKASDVFCLPSQGPGETWGLAVNEAMASGRAILVSNKCGCAVDLVKDNFNGYIVHSNDQIDLTSKMLNLSNQKKYIEQMKGNSLSIIDRWSFSEVCAAFENALINYNN